MTWKRKTTSPATTTRDGPPLTPWGDGTGRCRSRARTFFLSWSMRPMAQNSQIAHEWANQSKPHGRGSSFFYAGPTIYSYGEHFPVARLHTVGKRPVCLVTCRDYSQSTSAHKNLAKRAIRPEYRVFSVPRVNPTNAEHIENHAHIVAQYRATLVKSERARPSAAPGRKRIPPDLPKGRAVPRSDQGTQGLHTDRPAFCARGQRGPTCGGRARRPVSRGKAHAMA